MRPQWLRCRRGEGGRALALVSVSAETLLWFNWELSIERRASLVFWGSSDSRPWVLSPYQRLFQSLASRFERSFVVEILPAAPSLGDIVRKTSGA